MHRLPQAAGVRGRRRDCHGHRGEYAHQQQDQYESGGQTMHDGSVRNPHGGQKISTDRIRELRQWRKLPSYGVNRGKGRKFHFGVAEIDLFQQYPRNRQKIYTLPWIFAHHHRTPTNRKRQS